MITHPIKIIDQLGDLEGKYILDIGAGIGFYTFPMAFRAGAAGKVYALDVQRDLLQKLKTGAHESGLKNIEIICGDIEIPNGTALADNHVDIAVLSNTLFQLENKLDAFFEIQRVLKPNGKIVIVDWRDSFNNIGPHQKNIVSEKEILDLLTRIGYHNVEILTTEAYHYGMIGRAKSR